MIRHLLISSVRNLSKNRAYTLISVLGLALGLALGMFSMAYLLRELSFEDCHENGDRIYRVEIQYQHADTLWSSARVMAPLADEISREVAEVERVAVFRHQRTTLLTVEEKKYTAGRLIFAQPEFFDVFTMPIKIGSAASLSNPNSVLITDTVARTYFPDQNPVGQTVTLGDSTLFTIAGVLEDIPTTTQLYCDFVASYSTLNSLGADLDSWTDSKSDLTYLLLRDGADPSLIMGQIAGILGRSVAPEVAERYSFSLKPLDDIYFDTYFSGNHGELSPGWEPDMVIFLVGIGLFILIQSMANFISLATARGIERMKEIGIRKTFGADRGRLIAQFLGETVILTGLAMVGGLLFLEIFKRGYDSLGIVSAGKTYELANLYGSVESVLLIIAFTIAVGILAGFYPALYLSRFKPISVLKDTSSGIPRKSLLRNLLVGFQFTLAIFFLTATFGWYQQLDFITKYDLGFDQDDMMVLRFSGPSLTARDCAIAKNEILAHTDVLGAARSNRAPGDRFWSTRLFINPERQESDLRPAKMVVADYDFLSFYGIQVVQGRGFSEDRPEDVNRSIVINESMRETLGTDNPVGQWLYTGTGSFEIIGVVRDFQVTAMDWSYRAATAIFLNPDSTHVLCLKLQPDDIAGLIGAIQNTWDNTFGDQPFVYSFLDEEIRDNYTELDVLLVMFGALSLISIVIACLGIFGLVSFTVERKTKEIAIRKVLGASPAAIFNNITIGFVKLIAISTLIAAPLAYPMILFSLEEYPVQANIGIETYLAGGLLTVVLALMTAAFHVVAAARANPVDALKYE